MGATLQACRWCCAVLALVAAPAVHAQIQASETGWSNPADGTRVPALVVYDRSLARGDGTLPAILFVHPRRGLQEPERKYLAEIAALGYLVLAPDWQSGRLIEPWPIAHDPATEMDVALGLEHLKTMPQARPSEKRTVYGYSRGGYYAVRIAVGALNPRHAEMVGCLVANSGHFQNPNAPEPDQAFRYMPELDQLRQPILMMVGTAEAGVRLDNNVRAFHALVERRHEVELVMLPQARRVFDYREHLADEGATWTAAERTAKRYAMGRLAAFLKTCTGG